MEEAAQQPRKTMLLLLLLQLLLLPLADPLLARECRGELDAAGVLEVPGALSRAECEAVASHGSRLLATQRAPRLTRHRYGTVELKGAAALPWLEERLRRLAPRQSQVGELELVRFQAYETGGRNAARAWHR